MIGHSSGACSKSQDGARPVEKKCQNNDVVTNKTKGNVFTRLSHLVGAPPDSQAPNIAQEEQQFDQAEAVVSSDGWETVRKKKNGNKQHCSPTAVMTAESNRPPQ